MLQMIDTKYGSYRGLIRLWLDKVKWYSGIFKSVGRPDWSVVQRLVFVCQGNICRSPYGHALAERSGIIAVASFGYATSTGAAASSVAIKVAAERGVDLTKHKTTDVKDFTFKSGDLLLIVEPRHLAKIEPIPQHLGIQIALLGLWCEPITPLIYDPHTLSEEYFHSCYARIETAVSNLLVECSAYKL